MRCELLKKSFSLKLDSVKDIRFSSVLYFFISKQISKSLSLRASTPESHEIEDFVVEETCFLGQTRQAPGAPSQYWRVGSSPISRTGVKDIRFSSVLYFYI